MAGPRARIIEAVRRTPTLDSLWSPADNGITALRLVLASWVFLAHSFTLGGAGRDPIAGLSGGQVQGGTVAVSAFFALSGFLLVQSRARTRTHRFVLNRARRILPGYWACLIVVGFILVPVAGRVETHAVDVSAAIGYVVANAGLIIGQHDVAGVFGQNPVPSTVNGSLWTLAPEVACYLALAVVPSRWLRIAVPAATIVVATLHLGGPRTNFHDLILSFGLGATAGLARSWIPVHRSLVAVGIAVLAVGIVTGEYRTVAPFAITYLTLVLAVAVPWRVRTDLSYGVYIYAYPVQQLVVLAALPFVSYVALSGLLTLALAAASWVLVERPALRVRPKLPPTGRVVTAAAEPVPA